MAAIRDFAVTEYGTATIASLDCNMPVHEANDILIYFASKDGAIAINDPGGIWTNIQDGITAGAAYRCGWALATGNDHTLTLVTGTAENWTVVVLSIKNANTVSPISASAESAVDDTAMPFDGPSTNTGTDTNCLILHAWFSDSGLSPTAYAPLINVYAGDNGANSTAVAYTYQRAAGVVAAASWYGRANDDGRGVVVAVKDNGNETEIPPYSDPAISSGQVLRPLVGLATTFSDTWPTSLSLTALGKNFEANSVYIYEVLPSWADKTAEANSPTTGDITWPIHVGDMMYFGHSSKFATLSFITSTAGVTGVVVWEYWNGGSWVTATGMSGAFTATGGARIAFTRELIPANWVQNDPGMGQTKYWVRCRITTAYTTAVIQSMIRLSGFVAAYIVATASADAGTNPYTDATQDAGASSTANLSGPQINFGAALDMDTGIIVGTLVSVLPSDFAKDIAEIRQVCGGIQITLLDTNNNYLSYKLGAKACKDVSFDDRNVFAIDWNGAAVPWASAGTINKSAVTKMFLSTYGYFQAAAHRWSMLSLVTRIGIAGGTSAYPLDLDKIIYATNACIGIFPFIKKSGSSCMIYAPLQFGGNDPVRISCNLNTFQFPKKYDDQNYYLWNAADDVAGIKFYPKAGDVLKFTNCVFTSESSYRFEFDPSSSASATLDFSGTTVIGANVILDNAITLSEVTFSNCKEILAAGATLSGCIIKNSVSTVALRVDSVAEIDDKITGCSFLNNNRAVKITAPGTYEFDALMFSGNTYDIENSSAGLVTINCINGSNPTTYINTGGGTTSIIQTVVLTLTGLPNNTEVTICKVSDRTVLYHVENSSGNVVYQYGTSEIGLVVDILAVHLDYDPQLGQIYDYTLGSDDTTIPIALVADPTYYNP